MPTQSCLVLYSYGANLLHSLIMWLIVSSLPTFAILMRLINSHYDMIGSYGVVLCRYLEGFWYYHYYYYLHLQSFSRQCLLMVFHWSLSDSKSPQISRNRLSILAHLSKAVIWVSTSSPNSKSSRPFNNPLVIVPNAPITIGTIVTFMFHSFFNSLARSKYLYFFSHFFRFILWSAGAAKSTILQIIYFLGWLL